MAGTVCWQGGQDGGQKKTVAIPKRRCRARRPHSYAFGSTNIPVFSFFFIYARRKKENVMPAGECAFAKLQDMFLKAKVQ